MNASRSSQQSRRATAAAQETLRTNSACQSSGPLDSTLNSTCVWMRLKLLNDGHVNEWAAPAIRGMVLKPLREQFCQLTPIQLSQLRSSDPQLEKLDRYCLGCPENSSCTYGKVFEPDLKMIQKRVRYQMRDGLRGITFLTPLQQPPGELHLRLLATGDDAQRFLPTVIEAVHELGQTRGLGPKATAVRFHSDVEFSQQQTWQLQISELIPDGWEQAAPLVRLQLETPLSIKARRYGRKNKKLSNHIQKNGQSPPSFSDIFRNCIRIVTRAIGEHGAPETLQRLLDNVRLDDLNLAAENVEADYQLLERWQQNRASSRSLSQWNFDGWHGSLLLKHVPVALLPWLVWAGRLGVGDSRNVGAGTWHLTLAYERLFQA